MHKETSAFQKIPLINNSETIFFFHFEMNFLLQYGIINLLLFRKN